MVRPLCDESGNIVATPGLQLKNPWIVLPSARHEGYYFFYNNDSKKSAWILDPCWLLDEDSNSDAYDGKLVIEKKSDHAEKMPTRRTAQVASLTSAHTDKTVLPEVHHIPKATSAPILTSSGARSKSIDAASLVVVGGLGQGCFADVVQVKETTTGNMFAMKVVAKKRLQSAKSRINISTEHRLLTEIDPSPFVLRACACFESATNVFFVTDLCAGGNLFSYMVSRYSVESDEISGLPEDEARMILAELALAIEHVHGQGYLHKDIKIENVMLDGGGHVKLVDFGLAEAIAGEHAEVRISGTWTSLAPELIRDGMGGRHTDWWAYGVLAFELLTGFSPWSSLDDVEVLKHEILNCEPDLTDLPSSLATSFLKGLLRRNHSTRLGTRSDKDVRSVDFFKSIDWKATELLKNAPSHHSQKIECMGDVAEATLASYCSRDELPRPGEVSWYLGFDVVAKHPRVERISESNDSLETEKTERLVFS